MPFDSERATAVLASVSSAGLAASATGPIPAGFRPTMDLFVSFGAKQVELGNSFVKSECAEAPKVYFEAEDAATYTLFLVDPDAPYPNDNKFANWRHWVVTGLRPAASGSQGGQDIASTGTALTQYLAPGPKDDSEPHRYLFQLFREPKGGLGHLTKADIGGEEFVERRSFDSVGWAAARGLELVAANWMSCASDAWVRAE
ncbi:hypothetical protein MCOR27_005009 [Pyricularia oryzae]|uniref:Phosphatidylethanolamine-binding protein n=5 Tax=Pyricularia TaxID=48558 RepID=A0ABQ8NWH5_PYRGI|nr:phosphatidylethanolamine-binding protein [Pyricularia oryzae 70-15]ELQ36743.1 phosphatidylethanolamine-binding protein [Pyricularia oryzae Y34]KAH8839281.1 hypothetical protein MCOR01_008488 [Pyricularia oryzae]KAI6303154.1 hypothetical protein MCOR33_001603 [Pyricularia grisea]EHA55056.1 phosphatidylethanolamine-binding protein [Pyricularia oryzae 70-15]KAH9439129.1 hypothetical protein MCOR02_002701 [Pyricularia oryzae]